MNIKNTIDRYVLRPILIASAIGLAGCGDLRAPTPKQEDYIGAGSVNLNFNSWALIPDSLGDIVEIREEPSNGALPRSLHNSGRCSLDSFQTFTAAEDTRAIAKRITLAQDTLRYNIARDMAEQYNAKHFKH